MTRRLIMMMMVAIGASLVLSGCTPEEKHRLLTFFFDGVPPLHPAGEETPAQKQPTQTQKQAAKPSARASKQPKVVWYSHKPATDETQCAVCHNAAKSFALVAPKEQLCLSCHEHQQETRKFPWMHGPVAIGACAVCHEAHRSQYKHLVSTPGSKLCFQCHEPTPKGGKTLGCKRPSDNVDCTRCHNAHGGRDRFFLVANLTSTDLGKPNDRAQEGKGGEDANSKPSEKNSLKPDEPPDGAPVPGQREVK